MRILLFGASGQVGTNCKVTLQHEGYELQSLTRNEVDFADTGALYTSVVENQPDIVINACAYTAVDRAEEEYKLANQINHLSVVVLARACEKVGALLIHLSTDYVFDGSARTPYLEDDDHHPLGVYGKTKFLGEQAVITNVSQYIILRTSWVFGRAGNNFVKTMLRLGAERESLSVVDDQIGRPTYVGHIVDVILSLVRLYQKQGVLPWGVYHCSSHGEVSWYQFAQAIFSEASRLKVLKHAPHVDPIPSSAYPTSAPRPQYSVLNTQKLEVLMGYKMPHWQYGLEHFFSGE